MLTLGPVEKNVIALPSDLPTIVKTRAFENCGTTKGSECGCCGGVDEGGGEANAESGKQGMETDFGCTGVLTGGGAAGGNWGINCRGEGYENKTDLCAVYVEN